MGEGERKKREKDFDFVFDLGDVDSLFRDLMQGMGDMEPGKPMVMGFNIRVGKGGKPRVERFGNIAAREGKPVVSEARQPLVDVRESEKEVTVTAELPGVEKEEIRAEATSPETLEIRTTGETRFHKRVGLNTRIKPESAKAKFKNGILEVRLEKKKGKGEIKIK